MARQRLLLWLRALVRPRAVERDLDEEIRFHLDAEIAANVREGLPPDEARRRALADFGGVDRTKEDHRDGRGVRWLADGLADVRYALRQLVRAPTFAASVVLTLALGLGANAIVFALIDAVVLHPVSGVREPASLFELGEAFSYPAFRDLQARVPTLAGMRERRIALDAGAGAGYAIGGLVSGNFFGVVGVGAALGRVLTAGDDVPGAAPVAVLAWDYWKAEFSGDTAILGRGVRLNGAPFTIVGVADRGFRGLHLGERSAVWIPIRAWTPGTTGLDIESRNWSWLGIIGRSPEGTSPAQLRATLTAAMTAAMPGEHPDDIARAATPRPAEAAALPAGVRDGAVRFLAVLAGVVVLVLIAACANIAGLLVSRATYREREIAARIALGASRGRLVRQLLTEAIVLAAAGGLAGLCVFAAGRALLMRATLPGGVPGGSIALHLDLRLAAFAIFTTLGTGVLVGLMPALQASRTDTVSVLKGMSAHRGSVGHALRGGLITVQVAAGLVLLVGTGLFVRALERALAVDLGFEAANRVTLTVDPGLVRLAPDQAAAYYGAVSARVAEVPGVNGVTWTGNAPLTGDHDRQSAGIEGYAGPEERVSIEYGFVGPGYHEVMGIPMLRGRGFESRDGPEAARVVVINASLARRYFGSRDPIGARITMFGEARQVIGVARDVKHHELGETPRPYVYFPVLQASADGGSGSPTLIARTRVDATSLTRAVVEAARAVNPAVPIFDVGTMDARLRSVLAPQLAGAALFGVFSLLALIVAAVGIYGVVAYAVSQRTRGIGIRIALGAGSGSVLRLVVWRTLGFVALGIPIGLALATALGRAASRFLFGVGATDALTLAGMSALMLAVGLGASCVPALRAVRVDPLLAIRADT